MAGHKKFRKLKINFCWCGKPAEYESDGKFFCKGCVEKLENKNFGNLDDLQKSELFRSKSFISPTHGGKFSYENFSDFGSEKIRKYVEVNPQMTPEEINKHKKELLEESKTSRILFETAKVLGNYYGVHKFFGENFEVWEMNKIMYFFSISGFPKFRKNPDGKIIYHRDSVKVSTREKISCEK